MLPRRDRDPQGHFYPAIAVRMKVLHRCAQCGRELYQREVWLATKRAYRPELVGSLVHRRDGRCCGPVQFMENPQYRGGRLLSSSGKNH